MYSEEKLYETIDGPRQMMAKCIGNRRNRTLGETANRKCPANLSRRAAASTKVIRVRWKVFSKKRQVIRARTAFHRTTFNRIRQTSQPLTIYMHMYECTHIIWGP